MSVNGDSEIMSISLEELGVYLSIVARAIRRLDERHGAGAREAFLNDLAPALEMELRLSMPGPAVQLLLADMNAMLVRLVEMIPPAEDL